MPKKWGTCKECGRAAKHKDKCSQGIGGAPKQISQETARELLRALEVTMDWIALGEQGEPESESWASNNPDIVRVFRKAKKETEGRNG